jgi:hypothetical protein
LVVKNRIAAGLSRDGWPRHSVPRKYSAKLSANLLQKYTRNRINYILIPSSQGYWINLSCGSIVQA